MVVFPKTYYSCLSFLDLKVMFICNHCPYVVHLKEDIVKLSNNYMPVQYNFFPFFYVVIKFCVLLNEHAENFNSDEICKEICHPFFLKIIFSFNFQQSANCMLNWSCLCICGLSAMGELNAYMLAVEQMSFAPGIRDFLVLLYLRNFSRLL